MGLGVSVELNINNKPTEYPLTVQLLNFTLLDTKKKKKDSDIPFSI